MNRNSTSSDKQPQRPAPPSTRGKTPPAQPAEAQGPGVEGEGSYTATHRYNEGLREHIEQHDVESEAEEAREALEGDEREELEAAEEQGKRGPARGVRPVQQTESGLGGPQPQHGKG